MKNFKKLFILIAAVALIIPFSVMAKAETYYSEYNTLNYLDTLDDEELEYEFEDYSENDDQITIYMFRGKGCAYCRAFLTFMNSITEEYGEYFKLVSFEVWNDANNSELFTEVAEYLGEEAGGVPYIIIGDKVFPGYAEQYDDQIKEAITNLYNTSKEDRYDVFVKMNDKKDYSAVVGVVSVLVIGGIIALAVVTRRKNSD